MALMNKLNEGVVCAEKASCSKIYDLDRVLAGKQSCLESEIENFLNITATWRQKVDAEVEE